MQFIGTPDPVTTTKYLCNDGASYDNSDVERSASESDEDEELSPKKENAADSHSMQYVPVKMPEEDIGWKLFEDAPKLII